MRTKHPLTLIAVGALLALLAAAPARAQDQTAQLEAFRSELGVFFTQLHGFTRSMAEDSEGHPSLSGTYLQLSGHIEELQKRLHLLTYQDLYYLHQVISKNPTWLQTPQALNALFTQERRQMLRNFAGRHRPPKGSRVVEVVDETCSPGPGTPLGITDAIIAEAVVIAAETVMESLPDDFLSVAGKVVAAIAHGAAKGAWLTLRGLMDVFNECVDTKFQFDTISKLDEILTKLNDIIARLTAIEEKIDILDKKVDALRGVVDEIQAREVEESIDWCRPIASILLPNSRGGRLEQVRDLVKNFLDQAILTGPPAFPATATSTATTHFNSGIGQLTFSGGSAGPITGGDLKTAFQYFCKAYAALVKTP